MSYYMQVSRQIYDPAAYACVGVWVEPRATALAASKKKCLVPYRPYSSLVAILTQPFNAGIKSLHATLPDEIVLEILLLEPCISLIYA
jgi:hypothetical protein